VEDSLVATVVLPAVLAVIMAGLGLSLSVADFKRVLVMPRGIAIGLVNLAFVAPLLAFAVAELFSLPPELAVGLVLLGASPGGTMANLLTHLAKGDTALSVTMTAVSSFAAVITVPLYLGLAASWFAVSEVGDVDMSHVVARVFMVTIVPISIGMAVRARWPERVAAHYDTVRKLTLALFGAVVIGAVASQHQLVIDNATAVAGAALALNVAAMSISFGVAKVARLDDRQATAIALELGVHNSSLAIAVGASLLAALTIPAAVYSAFMFVTGIGFAHLMYRRNRLVPAVQPTA
jgi:BASS family bile acid:Na+ symporter